MRVPPDALLVVVSWTAWRYGTPPSGGWPARRRGRLSATVTPVVVYTGTVFPVAVEAVAVEAFAVEATSVSTPAVGAKHDEPWVSRVLVVLVVWLSADDATAAAVDESRLRPVAPLLRSLLARDSLCLARRIFTGDIGDRMTGGSGRDMIVCNLHAAAGSRDQSGGIRVTNWLHGVKSQCVCELKVPD